MSYLEMSPLVAVSELHRDALRQRRAYRRGFFFGESLTELGDDQSPAYGIEDDPSDMAGCAC